MSLDSRSGVVKSIDLRREIIDRRRGRYGGVTAASWASRRQFQRFLASRLLASQFPTTAPGAVARICRTRPSLRDQLCIALCCDGRVRQICATAPGAVAQICRTRPFSGFNYVLPCVAAASPGSILYCFVLRRLQGDQSCIALCCDPCPYPCPYPYTGPGGSGRFARLLPERSCKSARPAHLPGINYVFLCVSTGGSGRFARPLPERSRKSAGSAHLPKISYVLLCVATAPGGSIMYCFVMRPVRVPLAVPVPVCVPGESANLRDRSRSGRANLPDPPISGSIMYCFVLRRLPQDQLCIALCCDGVPGIN